MNEKKRGYLKISKSWGECNCGCGRRIAPPGLMCIVNGFFFIATHERKVPDDFYFDVSDSFLTNKNLKQPVEEDLMTTSQKKIHLSTVQACVADGFIMVKPDKKLVEALEDFSNSQSTQSKESSMATTKKVIPTAKSTKEQNNGSAPVVAKKVVLPKAEKPNKAVKPKAEKGSKVPRITANNLCRELLLERKYTDDQITAKIKEVFPDSKFTNVYVSTTRVDLNKGYYKKCIIKEPISKLVEKDGKIVPSEEIKKERDAARAANRRALAEKKKVALDTIAAKKKLPIKKEGLQEGSQK